MAYGQMGMQPKDFLLMRPCDFWIKLKGFRESREEMFRADAELKRMQTTDLINIQLDPMKRIKPEQLWKFPWDKKEETEVTQEEADENLKKLIEAIE